MKIDYKRNGRKWFGVLCTLVLYYILHEGSHFIYANILGAFKQINFIGLGVQIEIYPDKMTTIELGIFCIIGAVVTIAVGWCLSAFTEKIVVLKSTVLKAVFYYFTIGMLIIDPLYLSLLCGFFGGGDMNGIVTGFGISEVLARIVFGVILMVNIFIFIKYVTPRYSKSYKNNDTVKIK